MSESVNDSWVYDASPEAAFRMLTRLDALTEQAAHLGWARFGVLELRQREGFFRVSAERQLTGARRGHSPRAMVRYSQRWHPPAWDGARRFDAVATVGGPGLTITGQGELQTAGELGTRYSMRLTVRSEARLFARQIERDTAAGLLDVMAAEHAFRQQWLAGRGAAFFPEQHCA